MSNNQQDNLIKEISELLETAQKEVLREINSRKSFFARVFSNDKKDNLKQAQSAISKALNQVKNLGKDGSSIVGKLQNNLNEKATALKKLEEVCAEHDKAIKDLNLSVKYYKDELAKAQEQFVKQETTQTTNTVETSARQFDNSELEEKIKDLEYNAKDYENRYKASQEDLGKSQMLSVELSRRLKRLKSELIN